MKTIIAAFALIFALAVYAYLPPVEERCGVKTDGSFRFVDWTIIPLPYSDGFSAEINLAAFGAAGRKVVSVDAVEPGDGAAAPSWSQAGDVLNVSCDAKSFAYRIHLGETRE